MANRDVIAIGASAGGIEALRFIASNLTPDLPASVLIALHVSPQSILDDILTRAGPLPASFAKHGERIERRRIYIAPAGYHLLLENHRMVLGTGPLENHARPAIDPLLRSVGVCCGARGIGVVLTGLLGDGASGLAALQRCGGVTIVQDPADAAFPEMPRNALTQSEPDHVETLAAMPALFLKLVNSPEGTVMPVPPDIKREVAIAKDGFATIDESLEFLDNVGERSILTCPDCNGVMWQINEGDLLRYRCHVGHAYSSELMSVALNESVYRAIASAQRVLEERIALTDSLAKQAEEHSHFKAANSWVDRSKEFREQAAAPGAR